MLVKYVSIPYKYRRLLCANDNKKTTHVIKMSIFNYLALAVSCFATPNIRFTKVLKLVCQEIRKMYSLLRHYQLFDIYSLNYILGNNILIPSTN